MGKLRARLTFANVVSVISLLFALGLGGAWAASELSKNEVKSKHIGKGQVKTGDLADSSVTSPKVADGSLLDDDFAPGQLPAGPPGEPGAPGADATKLFAYVRDPGPGATENAVIQYGSGVTGVEEFSTGGYVVSLNRDLTNCAAGVVAGTGQPSPTPTLTNYVMPLVRMGAQSVEVTMGGFLDTSFLITVFC